MDFLERVVPFIASPKSLLALLVLAVILVAAYQWSIGALTTLESPSLTSLATTTTPAKVIATQETQQAPSRQATPRASSLPPASDSERAYLGAMTPALTEYVVTFNQFANRFRQEDLSDKRGRESVLASLNWMQRRADRLLEIEPTPERYHQARNLIVELHNNTDVLHEQVVTLFAHVEKSLAENAISSESMQVFEGARDSISDSNTSIHRLVNGIFEVLGLETSPPPAPPTAIPPSTLRPTSTPAATATPTWEQRRAQTQTVDYRELFRNNEQYVGQHFYFRGKIVQVIERGEDTYDFRVDVEPESLSSAIVYLADYTGRRLLEDDRIEFVGAAAGLERYESIFGQSITIPRVKAVAVRWFGETGAGTTERTATPTLTPTGASTVTAAVISPAVTPTTVPTPTLTPTGVPTATAPTATVSPCANGIAVPNPQDNPGLVADCTVLLQVRDTLAGSAKLNWHADLAIANWEGITISDAPHRVVMLVLSDRELTGTIPPQLGALTHLQSLDLRDNRLTGTIPSQLGTLSQLRELSLGYNQLSDTVPPELGALVSLQGLWLHVNQLSGPIPSQLGALSQLRELSLGHNQLSGTIPPVLGALANLEVLYLSDNQLTGPIPPELGTLANLRMLRLDDNQLSGIVPPELGALTLLQELWLYDNRLTGAIPSQLGALAKLQGLGLSENQLTGPIPPELGTLTYLEQLWLDTNQLSGPIPPQLGSLVNLRALTLNMNQLSGVVPPQLSSLANLEFLSLGGNALTGCLPPALRRVARNDFDEAGLPFCSNTAAVPPANAPARPTPEPPASPTPSPTNTPEPSPASDRAALVALYNATDGANWRIKRNWLSDAPLRLWVGVETDRNGRVTSLDLGSVS